MSFPPKNVNPNKRLYTGGIAGSVIELGCGCALPGLVAAQLAEEVYLTDGFDSGLESARISLNANRFLARYGVHIEKLPWGRDVDPIVGKVKSPIKLILAADCLYPDMSAWPNFFCTLFQLLSSPSKPVALVAFHKRSGQQTLKPFLDYWKLKMEILPLSELNLDKNDNIGGTRLPGSSTGSIILYRISLP